jgi:hypothetical protein
MSLSETGYLKDFNQILKSTIEQDSEIRNTLSGALSSLSLSKSPDAASQISSLGIGFGLSLLGQYLATKKRGSRAAIVIARILGADVDAINRDFVLAKLKDPYYFKYIREKILDVLQNQTIDDFAKSIKPPLSTDEAWEVCRRIKDMVLDAEIMRNIAHIANLTQGLKVAIDNGFKDISTKIDKQLDHTADRIEKSFRNDLERFRLSHANIHLITVHKKYIEGNKECWKRAGLFQDEDIRSDYDARRVPIIDEIIGSIKNYLGTILYGESGSGKSMLIKRSLRRLPTMAIPSCSEIVLKEMRPI